MAAWAQKGNVSKAETWFRKMQQAAVVPNVFTYTVLIKAASTRRTTKATTEHMQAVKFKKKVQTCGG